MATKKIDWKRRAQKLEREVDDLTRGKLDAMNREEVLKNSYAALESTIQVVSDNRDQWRSKFIEADRQVSETRFHLRNTQEAFDLFRSNVLSLLAGTTFNSMTNEERADRVATLVKVIHVTPVSPEQLRPTIGFKALTNVC